MFIFFIESIIFSDCLYLLPMSINGKDEDLIDSNHKNEYKKEHNLKKALRKKSSNTYPEMVIIKKDAGSEMEVESCMENIGDNGKEIANEFLFENREFRSKERESNNETGPMKIPNAEQIASSPEITFGQDTMNMVDEFMRNETLARSRVKKGNIFKRVLRKVFCCIKRS
jgi:hypothetical protein